QEFFFLARRQQMPIVDRDLAAGRQVAEREHETQMPQPARRERMVDVAFVRPFRRDCVAILEPAHGRGEGSGRVRPRLHVVPFVYFADIVGRDDQASALDRFFEEKALAGLGNQGGGNAVAWQDHGWLGSAVRTSRAASTVRTAATSDE